jgi:hypothetical protein
MGKVLSGMTSIGLLQELAGPRRETDHHFEMDLMTVLYKEADWVLVPESRDQ